MADSGGEVKLYLDHVEAVVRDATAEVLKRLALRIEARTKVKIRDNDQIDTGFMVNSVYSVWSDGDGYDRANSLATNASAKRNPRTRLSNRRTRKQGSKRVRMRVSVADRQVVHEQLARGAVAGVVVGANYAIYQEARKPFLYPAAQQASSEFGGEATQIYREVLPDEGPRQ